MSWTDERTQTLKNSWLRGLSAGQIAKQLGGVTRNGVIGKVHRLGLASRGVPSEPTHKAFKPPPPPRVKPSPPQLVVDNTAKRAGGKLPKPEAPGSATMLTLGAHMCKWPIGDPSSDDFTFCGKGALEGEPYCKKHDELAHQPLSKRSSKRV